MNVNIKVIPHAEQRYPTCGDWFFLGDDLEIRVSKMSDWRYEFMIARHEWEEAIMCEHEGITQKQVDDFDMEYEKNRAVGDESEPGDHPQAPYRRPHFRATTNERIMADILGVNWDEYADEIESLP